MTWNDFKWKLLLRGESNMAYVMLAVAKQTEVVTRQKKEESKKIIRWSEIEEGIY